MNINELERLGLKEREAKIYIELLKNKESIANHIAKKTNILRSSIYDYIDRLLDKGFISYTIKSGKKYFKAANPEKLFEIFEEKIKKEEQALKEIIPRLNKIKNHRIKNVNTEVYEGKNGLKTVMAAILRERPNTILIYGSSGVSYKLIPFFMEHWHRERCKLKIPIKIIYSSISKARKRIKNGPTLKLAKIRFLKQKDTSLTGTIIYNNKVLITIWDENVPIAISIESDEISKNYKNNFKELWNNSIDNKNNNKD